MTERPTLLCLHGLGAAGRAFDVLRAAWDGPSEAPDLPGFGSAPPLPSPSVAAYADWVADRLERLDGPVLLLGWSMGGKFALALAARRPERLAGLVLLAPSPPGGEPMDEAERAAFVADGPTPTNAAANADDGPAAPLPPAVREAVVADWLASDPATFRWWFSAGSREVLDVSAVDAPVLILGGDKDAQLDAATQAKLTAPKLDRVSVEALPGVGHLIPHEAPQLAAERITAWWNALQPALDSR